MTGGSRVAAVLAALVVGALACGGETGVEPPVVAAVEVTSPLGSLWDVGAGVQLAASASDAQGNPASGAAFTWTSSNAQVVSVSPGGLIEALAIGSATIQAEAGGVTGSLPVQVVDADLAGITALAGDAFATALVTGTSSPVRTALLEAVADCATAAGQGHLEVLQECIAAARTQVAGATDPTDRALLAVLSLFVDRIERLLNL